MFCIKVKEYRFCRRSKTTGPKIDWLLTPHFMLAKLAKTLSREAECPFY